MSTSERKIHSSQPLKVITLAHAVRRHNSAFQHKPSLKRQTKDNNSSTASKVRDLINKYNINTYEPITSHAQVHFLPSGRIYSKVATRKRPVEPQVDVPQETVDLSYLGSLKLQPWLNRPNQRRRHRSTELDRIVKEMKIRCSQINVPQTGLLSGISAQRETNKQRGPLILQDENPLECQESTPRIETLPDISDEDPKPEFVWNPVIVNNDQYTNVFSYLDCNTRNDIPCSIGELRCKRPTHMGKNYISPYGNYNMHNACSTPSTSSDSTMLEEALSTRCLARLYPRRMPTSTLFPENVADTFMEQNHYDSNLDLSLI